MNAGKWERDTVLKIANSELCCDCATVETCLRNGIAIQGVD